jgi:hypothetical protein
VLLSPRPVGRELLGKLPNRLLAELPGVVLRGTDGVVTSACCRRKSSGSLMSRVSWLRCVQARARLKRRRRAHATGDADGTVWAVWWGGRPEKSWPAQPGRCPHACCCWPWFHFPAPVGAGRGPRDDGCLCAGLGVHRQRTLVPGVQAVRWGVSRKRGQGTEKRRIIHDLTLLEQLHYRLPRAGRIGEPVRA